MSLVRVRVELADTPGALAGITTALAAYGVDVAGIDVLELDGASVVDELLLRLPPATDVDEVTDALRVAGAVEVLSWQVATAPRDPTVQAYELARTVLGDPAAAGAALARASYADVGAVVPASDAARWPLAVRALDAGVPACGRAGPGVAPLDLDRGWVVWVVPQVPEPQELVVVGRRLDVRFSSTETARLRAFAALVHTARSAVAG